MNAVNGYRLERWLYVHKLTFLAKIIRGLIYLIHNSYIPYTAEIGKGTVFGYKVIGVVVHSHAKIGNNCVISQNVTLGGREGHKGVPTIGNNVHIGAGAIVLGGVTVGDNAVVGAGAVVLIDIPENCVAAGVPAKVLYNRADREKKEDQP